MSDPKKYLFLIDLDGTLLQNSENDTIEKKNITAVQKLTKKGHIVCIATGRSWRSTEKIYQKLGLTTLVANYNGAQIHNPRDYSFIHNISYMNLNEILYVMGDKKFKKARKNIAIEGPSWVMVEKRDVHLEKIFSFSKAKNLKVGFDIHKLPLNPISVIFDIKDNVDIKELNNYLNRTYGDFAEFSWFGKGEGLTPVFDMTSLGVTKAKALSLMARYYGIPLKRTIAIGDNYNDVSMFKIAELAVAMANADQGVKNEADYVTKKTNQKAGVADFISIFFKTDPETVIKKIKSNNL